MTIEKTNRLTLKTPEGILFSFYVAGPVIRFLAWGVDLAVISVITSVTSPVLGLLGIISYDIAMAIRILYFFVLSIGYGIVLEWYWKGQTIGKKLLRLRIMDKKGLRLQFSQVVVRNLLRCVDSLPVFYLVGGIVCVLSKMDQRLGDIAANTIVIRMPKIKEPDLGLVLSDKYNSFREYPNLEARLRQSISPAEAGIAVQALYRRDQMDPLARIELFKDLSAHFRALVEFPQEATEGISDEQYTRNVVNTLFRTQARIL